MPSFIHCPYSGFGYTGIYLVYPTSTLLGIDGFSEYIQLKLSKRLIGGKQYNFSFFIKAFPPTNNRPFSHTTDCINVKFTTDSIVYANNYLWEIMEADWKNSSGNYIMPEWKEFKGEFIAKGDEEWMIIGFIDNPLTFQFHVLDTTASFVEFSYVFIDNCRVEPIISLPNVFTPNGDGKNDMWLLNKLTEQNYKVLGVNIYNRWGKPVFEAISDFTGWDGNCNGEPCSEGVYFVTAMIENKNNNSIKKYSGYITLLR